MNYRNSNNTKEVEITEIQNGDYIWNQGYLFKVTELSIYDDDNRKTDWGKKIMRYKGIVVDGVEGNEQIKGTTFDGGHYGHNNTIKALIVKRELLP